MFNKKTKEIYPFRTDNAIKEPKAVNAMPHVTLITVYKEKFSHSPALSSNRDSLANVEKVVKPPQKPTVKNIYRIRKSWADAKSQIGAYSSLENAKKACKTGYSVFDANGVNIYTSKTTASAVPFKIKVAISDLNIRKGPGTNYARTKYIPVGVYTIIEVQSGTGSDKGWGRLKSGAGWISLDFCTKV